MVAVAFVVVMVARPLSRLTHASIALACVRTIAENAGTGERRPGSRFGCGKGRTQELLQEQFRAQHRRGVRGEIDAAEEMSAEKVDPPAGCAVGSERRDRRATKEKTNARDCAPSVMSYSAT